MRVLILPAFLSEDRSELEVLCRTVEAAGFSCDPHRWAHWENPGVGWSNRREIELLEERIRSYGGDPFAIVAKSVGTYVACQLMVGHPELLEQVHHLLLLGIPLKDTHHVEVGVYPAALTRYRGRITVIQNSDDPLARATQIDSLLTGSKARLIVKERSEHAYPYHQEVAELLEPARTGI
ncbi:MAG: hypothetical protein ACOC45_00995 [Alkalispirochaetaceae bacterium]